MLGALPRPSRRHRHRRPPPGPVVTSDPRDITRIADSIGVKIRIYPT
jgi:hypothetical protein